MKTGWFEDFLALAEEGSFSRAAQRRNSAQPAFSRRIKSLERWAGTPLFNRTIRPIELTHAGQLMRPIAEDVLRQIRHGQERVRYSRAGANAINFSLTPTLAISFFPKWIRTVGGFHGFLGFNLQASDREACIASLDRGECHFMLCLTDEGSEIAGNRYASKIVGRDFVLPTSVARSDGRPVFSLPGSPGTVISHALRPDVAAFVDVIVARLESANASYELEHQPTSRSVVSPAPTEDEDRGVIWVSNLRLVSGLEGDALIPAGDESWMIPLHVRIFKSHEALPALAEEFWDAFDTL